jgi:hypothetical protein
MGRDFIPTFTAGRLSKRLSCRAFVWTLEDLQSTISRTKTQKRGTAIFTAGENCQPDVPCELLEGFVSDAICPMLNGLFMFLNRFAVSSLPSQGSHCPEELSRTSIAEISQ